MLFALLRPTDPSLEELVPAAVRGEGAARRELARATLARVLHVAGRVGLPAADLEGIAGDTLQEAFGALATFRGETPFLAWVDQAAARVLLRRESGVRRRDVERVLRELATEDDAGDAADASHDHVGVDDLTARRLERAAIAALDRAPSAAPVAVARRQWAWAAFGAIAVACAGLITLAAVWPRERRITPRLDAVIVHAAGAATIAGAPARAGRWLGAGADFDVPGGGKLAFGLGDGTIVTFAEGSRGTIEAWTLEDAKLRLDEGTLVARVAGRSGRDFALLARGIVVHADAAIVALTADRDPSVRVSRGKVTVVDRAGRKQQVVAGRSWIGGAVRATDAARQSADWALAGRGILQVHGARMQIETTPPGATVELDGQDVGRTPLTLLARTGARRLSVTLADHAPVREHLDLTAGQIVTRHFELSARTAPAR